VPTPPSWSAAVNGLPGDLTAVNQAAQVSQHLGTHAINCVYRGNQILSTISNTSNTGDGQFFWLDSTFPTANLLVNDLDQAFVMPAGATTIGRVTIACRPIGVGADLQLTLYPDSGGSPNTASPIATVTIPSGQIANLGASAGLTNGGTLATADFNAALTGTDAGVNWAAPAGGADGAGYYASMVVSGSRFVFLGGTNNAVTTASSAVASVTYQGGGNLSDPIPQPSLPQAAYNGMAASTPTNIVFMGGQTVGTSVIYNNVWTASWDPLTNVIGSWTAQTALPTKLCQGASASWNNTVYVIGGTPDGTAANATSAVYYADATNGQIRNWIAASPLPIPLTFTLAGVVGNWLIVAGGKNTAGANVNTVYYAAIQSDGSLGGWKTGPALPQAVAAFAPGWNQATTDASFLCVGSGTSLFCIQSITATAAGLASEWEWRQRSFGVGAVQSGAFSDGTPGEWTLFTVQPLSTQYNWMHVYPVPMISAPLHATGLTPGATYHLTVHQAGGDANNYIQVGEVTNPTAWTYRPIYTTGAWTPHADHALAINLYDTGAVGNLVHTWEDPDATGTAAATSTYVYDGLGRLLGLCEATAMPKRPLNSNPTFTSGISPWTATGGTLTQSNAQTHGNYPFSGLLTPDGASAQAVAKCELVPIDSNATVPGPRVLTADAWLYSPTGYGSVSLSINWYDSGGSYLSTSSNTSGIAAATWTHIVNTFLAPATAAYAALVPTESGTPAASNLLYLSNAIIQYATGIATTLSSQISVNYDSTGNPVSTTRL
jgi:hypothetical protein